MYYYTYLRNRLRISIFGLLCIQLSLLFIYGFRNDRKIAKSDYQLCDVDCRSLYQSVCLFARNYSAPTRRNFMKLDVWVFFENLSTKFKCNSNLTRITETLREDQYTCMIIYRSVLLRIRNFSVKSCREKNTHFMFNNPLLKFLPLMR